MAEVLGTVSSVIAVVEAAGAIAKICAKYIVEVKGASRDIERLQQQVAALTDVVNRLAGQNDKTNPSSISLPAHVFDCTKQCTNDLQLLHTKLQPKTGSKAMSKIGLRALKWPLSKDEVNNEVKRLEGYLAIFSTALQIENIAISKTIESKIDKHRDDGLLRTISQVGDAAYNSYQNQRHRECLDGTRVDLLKEIMDWAGSDSSQYIYWLRGRAGTGKSTIALTIARSLEGQAQPIPVASFFFKRGGGDLARSRRVVSTIAFQLAFRSNLLGALISKELEKDPSLAESASLSDQYNKLILVPLQNLRDTADAAARPQFVVVLDALDECDDVSDVRLLLAWLGNKEVSGLGLRLLVTSRPEVPIRMGFDSMDHIVYQELALHDIARETVEADIRKFVTHEMARIKVARDSGPRDFLPTDKDIQAITVRADGLFIYAATVCRYLDCPRQVSATSRLKQVCEGGTGKHKSTDALDAMYMMVLESSLTEDFSEEEAEEITLQVREIVGAIVLLCDTLSAEDLGGLLYNTTDTGGARVQLTLDSLHAILDVPKDPKKDIRMQHLSFRDFLIDSARCSNPKLYINAQQKHHDLLVCCLNVMKKSLERNICSLDGPGAPAASEDEIKKYISPSLLYACRHWTNHAQQGHVREEDNGIVHKFLCQHFLHWLEVMAVTGKVPEAISAFRRLENIIEGQSAPNLSGFFRDASRFISSFTHAFAQAPLQIYSAGLIFCPTASVLREYFSSELPNNIEVKTQHMSDWDCCIQTLEGHKHGVSRVAVSPDGLRIASGCLGGTVQIWDSKTGYSQRTLKVGARDEPIRGLMFFPDGIRLAAAGDEPYDINSEVRWGGVVRVWNVETGEHQHLFGDHRREVSAMAVTREGSRLVSAFCQGGLLVWDVGTGKVLHKLNNPGVRPQVIFTPDDSTILSTSGECVIIWDAQTGKHRHRLDVGSEVNAIAVSPEGSLVACGSAQGMVSLWELQSGRCRHQLATDESVYQVIFSPDGLTFASKEGDYTIRIWDVGTGNCEATHEHPDHVAAVAFSPDGLRIATGSLNHIVRLWDTKGGLCLLELAGHMDDVKSIAFSPDGSTLVSGSGDHTVRVWDVETPGYSHPKFNSHANNVHSGPILDVSFSLGSPQALVATGSVDRTARLWDAWTGQCKYVLQGHSDQVGRVEFSSRGLLLASGSLDKTVKIWDVVTGQCLRTFVEFCGPVNFVCGQISFSPDDLLIAFITTNAQMAVWAVQTGECRCMFDPCFLSAGYFGFSPRATRIVCFQCSWDSQFLVRDIPSNTEILRHKLDRGPVKFLDEDTFLIHRKAVPLQLVTSLSDSDFEAAPSTGSPGPSPKGLALSGREWVTIDGRKVLWLPVEFRSTEDEYNAVEGKMMAIVSDMGGRVTFVHQK